MSGDERPTNPIETEWQARMVAAQAGSQEAYDALLRGILPFVRATARRTGVPVDQLDDVAQDVLMTLHRVRRTYDPTRPFGAWLTAITRRRAIDALRRLGREQRREVHDPIAYEQQEDGAPSPIERIERDGQRRLIEQELGNLPPMQQDAVRRLALDGQSLADASAQTGRSVGTLKVTLHRALKALRERLRHGA